MTGEKAKCRHIQKTLLRECHSNSDSHFPPHLRKRDCTQNPAMPLSGPIETNASCAILAPRLLQAVCIILHSLVRLITSHNHIASIMDMIPVSTSHAIDHAPGCDAGHASLYYKHSTAETLAGRDSKESIFLWQADPTGPLPHAPMRDSSQCGNPSPHKNCLFVCQ